MEYEVEKRLIECGINVTGKSTLQMVGKSKEISRRESIREFRFG